MKSTTKSLKRKNLPLNDVDVTSEKTMESKVKKKKKNIEIEAPVMIPDTVNTDEVKKLKKEKKRKKKAMTETSDPPTGVVATHEGNEEEDLSPEERRVLERKMKKILKKEEKKRLKAEGETRKKTEESGPSASQLALDYLTCWMENRQAWKFQKTRQTWLLQHMFDSEKIPDEKFSVLLQYLEGLCGAARDTTAQKALTLVEESGNSPEDTDAQQRAHRAREVIQLFS